MNKEWIKIYNSSALYEVEVLKSRLEAEEIPAVILNKRDSAYLAFGQIELYTQREFAVKALNLIKENVA